MSPLRVTLSRPVIGRRLPLDTTPIGRLPGPRFATLALILAAVCLALGWALYLTTASAVWPAVAAIGGLAWAGAGLLALCFPKSTRNRRR